MIEGLRPYPAYRDSGLAWLGEVPAHWRIQRLKTVLRESQFRSDDGSGTLLSLSRSLGLISRRDMTSKLHGAKTLVGYKCYQSGQIVMNRMQAWSGLFGTGDTAGLVSPDYAVFDVLHGHVTKFILQRIMTPELVDQFALASKGIGSGFNRLYTDRFGPISISLPPADEQAAIVRFLNHATRQLDKAIRAKRKTIALLNEQKQAIIHRAVTRGLEPNEVLKDSNVLWLGEIPAHWDIVALKTLAEIQSGITLGKVYASEQLTEYPYLRVANVQAGRLALGTVKKLLLPKAEANRSMLQTGDVLMTEGGDPDKLGRGCVWGGEIDNCIHQNHVFAVRPSRARLRSSFLSAVLESHYAKRYFLQTAKQTTNLASTNKTTIGRFRIPLPNLDEQDAILRGIENESKPIARTTERIEREISLLREYRTRLIADVVTGKLDVREAAAHLPTQDPTATEPADAPDDTNLDEPAEDLAEAEAGA